MQVTRNRSAVSRLLFAAALALAIAFLAAAALSCGSGSTSGVTNQAQTAAGTDATVSMRDISFNPASLTVKAGTEVTWNNDDSTAHTVTSDTGIFDSGNLAPHSGFSYTFDQPGTFQYHCKIHADMKGTITVQ